MAVVGGALWFGVLDDGDDPGGVGTMGVDGGPDGDRDGGRSSSDQRGSAGGGADGQRESAANGTGRDATGGSGTGNDGGRGGSRGGDSGTADGRSGPDTDHFDVVTSEELTPFLLRGSDLPAGWRTIDVQPSNADPDSCLAGIDVDLAGGSQSAIVSFQHGSSGPTLTNAVTNYPRTETAAGAIDALRSAFDACEGHAVAPGSPSYRPAPVASTTADEAVAALITVDGQPRGRLVYARVGPRVTFVLAVGTAAASDGVADDAIEVVVTRLRGG